MFSTSKFSENRAPIQRFPTKISNRVKSWLNAPFCVFQPLRLEGEAEAEENVGFGETVGATG